DKILAVQKPVDQSLRETSAWLRVTAQAAAARETAQNPGASA
ncbi:MAG: methylenetetrahydrofolate reductase, partial [Mesorhizobium sp.]